MKRLLTFLIMFLSFTLVMGQELTINSFAPLSDGILLASTHRRNDENGQPCALILVQLTKKGATFEGDVIGDTPYSQSEYFVYMIKGSKQLKVMLEGYHPAIVDFTQYGVNEGVEGLKTYRLVINIPVSPNLPSRLEEDGKTFFTLTVTPKNASILIDGNTETLDDYGMLRLRLDYGKHTYEVSAGGYETKNDVFELGKEKKTLNVELVSTKATLTVKCPTYGATIYVNDEKCSSYSAWTGSLPPGSYLVEARMDGHYTQQQSVELNANQKVEVNLPALIARVGQLSISYLPVDAEVWIDGVKKGTSYDVFKNIVVGSHRVEIRKEGYQSEEKEVTIAEGQTATLSGSLLTMASSLSTTSASSMNTTSSSTSTSISTNSSSSQYGQTFVVNGVSFTMVRVEGGTFTMGATEEQGSDAGDDEKPAHKVALSSFSIGETEVTQELWEAVMGSNPSHFNGPIRPVENVNWNDCQSFIEKLNELTGRTFRLPTEAEWEYAARGGNQSKGYKYAGSNDLESVAWYKENGKSTHSIAIKQPNELGLYDMSGNVSEWCSDWYGRDYYGSTSQTNPMGPTSGQYRVNRGGCWDSNARYCRSSHRCINTPGNRYNNLGVRLVLSE